MIYSWRSILSLILFFLANVSVIFPTSIHVPFPSSFAEFAKKLSSRLRRPISKPDGRNAERVKGFFWIKFPLNFQTTPVAAVIFLLATKTASGSDVRHGVVGDNGIQPLNIMALFISLAYLSVSLDTTGLFRSLAFWVAKKGGSSGRRLYVLLYVFFFASGVIFGNDPVILSGTPFLVYFTRVSGIVPPTAWIYAQFSVANIASAILPPSNPTNLVVSGAFSISFISYTAHTVLPALAATVLILPFLIFWLFRSQEMIPLQIDIMEIDDDDSNNVRSHRPDLLSLTDKEGAIFGSVLFCVTLVVLVGTSPLKIPVWEITIPPAVIMLLRDVLHDIRKAPFTTLADASDTEAPTSTSVTTAIALQSPTERGPSTMQTEAPQTLVRKSRFTSMLSRFREENFPTLYTVIPRLPLSLVPFAQCMFIIVQTLTSQGWVEVFANWWKAWIDVCSEGGSRATVVGAVCGMLVVSTLLCNICGTNIGTTILLARVLQVWLKAPAPPASDIDSRVQLGSIYALAIGTNFGALTFTFSASLAGLLWRGILRQKGITVHQWQFAVTNLPIILIAVCTAGGVLIGEVLITG